MLQWALSFLILALVAGFLGFGGIAVVSIELARLLFWRVPDPLPAGGCYACHAG